MDYQSTMYAAFSDELEKISAAQEEEFVKIGSLVVEGDWEKLAEYGFTDADIEKLAGLKLLAKGLSAGRRALGRVGRKAVSIAERAPVTKGIMTRRALGRMPSTTQNAMKGLARQGGGGKTVQRAVAKQSRQASKAAPPQISPELAAKARRAEMMAKPQGAAPAMPGAQAPAMPGAPRMPGAPTEAATAVTSGAPMYRPQGVGTGASGNKVISRKQLQQMGPLSSGPQSWQQARAY